ncbi:hypothetical protein ELI_3029 [Eubacterium callanderi]|uniref:Uncharacterized protein n=1 Tax=Eubacterium callanderi TaxID=53442 RepID=E3GEY9_9FIRM|nr:hypothetical protein ELI_3029 [Eubacterium callanderi]
MKMENGELKEQNRGAILMIIKSAQPVWPYNFPFSILHSPL